jgi:hypothetical protein
MTVAVLVITDGRTEYIGDTIASFNAQASGPIIERWMYDDSGDPTHRAWLAEQFPEFTLLWHRQGRQGFGGAIRFAWDHLRRHSTADHIAHVEDDFVFTRPVDLTAMARLLDARPYIVQVALRRQPWNEQERTAGGVVECHPHEYDDREDGDLAWLEHTLFFSTNPSLYRRSLLDVEGWPTGARSEGRYTAAIRARHPGWRFAYWGARDDGPWVHHIGNERIGVGY